MCYLVLGLEQTHQTHQTHQKGKDIGETVSSGFELREWIDGVITTQKNLRN